EAVELAEYYLRYDDYSYSIYTEPFISGDTYPELPVYVLVNNKSASAAEELAFWLQNTKRATIIGENTSGAGYGARSHRLNDRFSIFISSSTERDPVTKKEFQFTGITPDVKAKSSEALEVGIQLALKDINQSKKSSLSREQLTQFLAQPMEKLTSDLITHRLIYYQKMGVIDYDFINTQGYENMEEPEKAVAILKTNAVLYPFFPNSFDSYADALLANKQYALATENYNKAVELATLKSNPSLPLYQQNSQSSQQRMQEDENEISRIKAALTDYIEGSTNGQPKRLKEVFHPDLNLYYIRNGDLRTWSGTAYISDTKEGKPTGEIGQIISIDYENDIATAKVEIKGSNKAYIDYFLLLKLEEGWKIIHKAFTEKKP
ncbi:MAG: nuclear transport factor 2 family protein, partial [Bacteroidota bacterium]